MKNVIKKVKGKKALSMLLALVMVLSVASPAFSEILGINAKAFATAPYDVELAYNNLFVFDNWARNKLSTTIMPNDEDNPYGKVTSNIEDGSVTIELLRNAPDTFGGIYTAHSGDTKDKDNNQNYYTIAVEPNTTYTFSYTLESTNLSSFVPYVFYFKSVEDANSSTEKSLALPTPGSSADAEGKYPAYNSLSVATNLNGSNTWSFTTPANADRIQIRFTLGNSADGSTSTVTVSDIIVCKTDLLTNENIFAFDEWASNEKSSAYADAYQYNDGTIDINESTDSITFNTGASAVDPVGLFTNFSIDATPANNEGFYTMDVKPSATYNISYILTDCNNLVGFGPAVAWFDESGAVAGFLNFSATDYNGGLNNHCFTTPSNAVTMQIAFGTFHEGAVGSGTVRNINVYDTGSIFSLRKWAANESSGTMLGGTSGLTVDTANNAVTFTTEASDEGTTHFTNFNLGSSAGFYTVDVQPETTYTYSYNVAIDGAPSGAYFQPWFAEFDASDNPVGSPNYHLKEGSVFGENQYTFTTGATTTKIMVVFAFCQTYSDFGPATWTVKNMTLCPTKTFEEITGAPHRGTFTYDHANQDEFYENLPTATAPEGYVFGGWYTGENGTGERITPETKVKYNSFSVFANFEEKVDKLEIATYPTKDAYTVGEKLDTTGLVLKATIFSEEDVDGNGELDDPIRTFNINSDIYCTPVYLNTVTDEQVITAKYGGKEVNFKVAVKANDPAVIVINGVSTNVTVANKNYDIGYTASEPFNRYEVGYYSDSYVKGVITFTDGKSEEFFLEPSDNGSFASYIDNFIYSNDDGTLGSETRAGIASIKFTCLNKENGKFELISLKTIKKDAPTNQVQYFNNAEYEMGIDILYGGVVAELYDKSAKNVTARVYNDPEGRQKPKEDENGAYIKDADGNYVLEDRMLTLVDYEAQLDSREQDYISDNDQEYPLTTPTDEANISNKVNLINTLDRGRYLQQSYYGTSERPYVEGEFNNSSWKYNPVQGGNVGEEPSKIIDYEITDTYVYIKARPMEWEKWSDDHVSECDHYEPITLADGTIEYQLMHDEALYGNDVISDTYVEAWYYFEDGMIKVDNRKVDYSGLPDAYTQQEMPALYLIEPLNHFVYNDVSKENAWNNSQKNMQNIEEPEFWGISKDYSDAHYKVNGELPEGKDKNNDGMYDTYATCNENWAAFTASDDPESFGVGIYTPGVTDLYYGVMPQIYSEKYNADGTITQLNDLNYRHAETVNPSPEMPTSYIAPLKEEWFRSYEATTYSYYLTTGTAEEIRTDFSLISDKEAQAELAKSKIAVPETVYLNPANNQNGQYYVNNLLDESDYYNVITEAVSDDSNMYFGIHVADAKSFTVNVTNVESDADDDIILGNADGTGDREGETISFDTSEIDSYISDGGFSLRLTNALQPGEKATAKWEITVTLSSGATETHTAYTVLYAPGRTVGAVAEARQNSDSQNEISSWITGANGVDHKQRSPLGSLKSDYRNSGYFRVDPLANPTTPPTGGSGTTAYDYISGYGTPNGSDDDNTDNAYVLQTATNDHDSSRAQSYLGLLTVDKSRYTNTNQIPNLKIGYDVLRIGSATSNSVGKYTTYYTLGTETSFTATTDYSTAPSGWTTHSGTYTDFADSYTPPYRESFVPAYDVSTIDGYYIHAINHAKCDSVWASPQYSMAGTSVLCSVTDKSGLRDAVLDGYANPKDDADFAEKLEHAAFVLGDPSATQEQIDEARKELVENATTDYYALKYDNLFSALEFSQHPSNMNVVSGGGNAYYKDGTISVVSGAITADNPEAYTNYGATDNFYLVDIKPNTEYVFEYEVTTNNSNSSQALVFLYKADTSNAEVPSNVKYQTNGGEWVAHDEQNPWTGNYGVPTGKYAIKFTTGATTAKAGFRFGNRGADPAESIFSNVKLVEASKYYADVEYLKTEDVYEEYAEYGTLPNLTRIGYTFNGWKDANDNAVTASDIAMEHKSIYSKWTEKQYTIEYDKNGNGQSSADATILYYTETKNLPDNFAQDNHDFIGWAFDPDATTPDFAPGAEISGKDVAAKADNDNKLKLYAVWEKRYTVYFSANGADPGSPNIPEKNQSYTSDLVLPGIGDVTKAGYTFEGWAFKNDATTIDFSANQTINLSKFTPEQASYIEEAEQQLILHAVWSTNTYTIGFEPAGGTISSSVPGSYNITDALTLPTPTREGYTFNDWKVTNADGNWVENDTVAAGALDAGKYGNVELTAQWTANSYNVTFNANGGSCGTADKTVTYDSTYGELPTPTREGFTFNGWFTAETGGTQVTEATNVTITSAQTLYAQWTENTYSIVFNANGGSGTTADILSIKFTQSVALTANGFSREGYDFLGWSTSAAGARAYDDEATVSKLSSTAGATVTLYAVWQINNSALVEDNIVVDFGLPMEFDPVANDTIFKAEAGDAYTFIGISTDDSNYTNTVAGTYGNFTVADKKITYTPTSIMNGAEANTVYYKVSVNNTELVGSIKVSPASNVYYEETMLSASGSNSADWVAKGTSLNLKQEASTENDVFGYDVAYQNSTGFSNGTYYKSAVTSISGSDISNTATFTFTGTGFDLISACGTETGIQVIKVSWTDAETQKTKRKSFIVDTYLSDSNIMTDDLVHQVPIINFRGSHNTYTVESTAAYFTFAESLKHEAVSGTASTYYSSAIATTSEGIEITKTASAPSQEILNELERLGFEDLGEDIEVIYMDDASVLNTKNILSGSAKTTFSNDTATTYDKTLYNFIDGVRVYSPLNGGDPYYDRTSEQNATYYNIVEELELDSTAVDKNMAYIESGGSFTFETDFNFDAYNEQGGPKGEIYLKKGDAIAFKFNAVTNGEDAYAMLGMRAVYGTANAKVYTASSIDDPYTKEISSATEMYYNVSPAVTVVNGKVTIIVANTGEGILAINNLKLVNGNQNAEDQVEKVENNFTLGDDSNGSLAPTPVVPDGAEGEEGNIEDIPETDVDTDTNIPENDTEADVEDETEINVSTMFPGMPASIASFLEMLFKLLGQLVGSLGF